MKKERPQPDLLNYNLNLVNDRIANQALIVFSVIAVFIQGLILTRSIGFGFGLSFYISSFSLLTIWAITLFRNRFNAQHKVILLCILVSFVLTGGLYSYGFLASAKLYIILFTVFVSLAFAYKEAIATLLIYMIIYMVFAYLYSNHILEYTVDIERYANRLISWIVEGSIIFLASVGLIYVGHVYREELKKKYYELAAKNKELERQEQKYRLIFESSSDAIFLIHGETSIDCNTATLDMFRCTKEDFLSRHITDFFSLQKASDEYADDKLFGLWQNVRHNNSVTFDWRLRRFNDEKFDVSISLNAVDFEGATYTEAVLRDITKKKQNERDLENYRHNLENLVIERTTTLNKTVKQLSESNKELKTQYEIINQQNQQLQETLQNLKATQVQLIESEKMASLGILTAGVAHEINNPLNFIQGASSGLVYLLEELNCKNDQVDELISSIKTGVERAALIVQGLNQFSRKNEKLNELCDLHKIIDNCTAMLRGSLCHNISITKKYTEKSVAILGNVGKMHQLFVNILTNAFQAIEDKGTIEISTETKDDQIRVCIADTGIGIKPEFLSKITEPFFTTKLPGSGTGLGLSISYSIVKQHGGSISFQSEEGKGTQVYLEFAMLV